MKPAVERGRSFSPRDKSILRVIKVTAWLSGCVALLLIAMHIRDSCKSPTRSCCLPQYEARARPSPCRQKRGGFLVTGLSDRCSSEGCGFVCHPDADHKHDILFFSTKSHTQFSTY